MFRHLTMASFRLYMKYLLNSYTKFIWAFINISFVIPIMFIIKLDWSVCICLTPLYDGRDMYRIYYIKNNYMFRHFTLAIFRLRNEKHLVTAILDLCELYTVGRYTTHISRVYLLTKFFFSFLNLKMANVKCRNM